MFAYIKHFSRWMHFNSPGSGTIDELDDFRKKFRKEAPVRFFLTRKLYWNNRFADMVWWVRYRTTNRNHIIKTGLPPGYHDPREVLLYSSFTLLVDFVEVENAWMNIVGDKEARKKVLGWKYFLPRIFGMRKFRSLEAGFAHLDWEIKLDDPSLPDEEKNPSQAEQARKVKELYIWWTEERGKREELPHPLAGKEGDYSLTAFSNRWRKAHPEESKLITKWALDSFDQESEWDNEDNEKLAELAQIRLGLWT